MSQGGLWLPSSGFADNLTIGEARGRTAPQTLHARADKAIE
jgi:hypothetical protein